jgi:hypothetical protein
VSQRYQLLLDDLVRHTPETHIDYKDLSAALQKMKVPLQY